MNMRNDAVYVVLVLLCLSTEVIRSVNGRCPAIIKSMSKVESCPADEQEWKAAEKKRNCTNEPQNCTNQRNFKYHCVIDSYYKSYFEICAPIRRIIGGYCVELNKRGERIQESHFKKCDDCPEVYLSNEAYKFQSCYDFVNISDDRYDTTSINGTINTSTIIFETPNVTTFSIQEENPETETRNTPTIVIFVPVAGLIVIAGFIAAVLFARKYKASRNKKYRQNAEEEHLLKTFEQEEEELGYVKTSLFRKAKDILCTERILFIIGPPCSGRSTIAKHLINSFANSKTKQYEKHIFELQTREVDESTLKEIESPIYVRVFHEGHGCTKTFGANMIKMKLLHDAVVKDRNLKLIVTASDSMAKNLCFVKFLKNTKTVLNTTTEPLSGWEKKEMFQSMSKRCSENAIEPNQFSKKNWKEFESVNPPIPFPLCAKLFLGNQKYQEVGIVNFFNDPVVYFEDKIKENINQDLKLKTLLLFSYLRRCKHTDHDIYGDMEKLGQLDFSYVVAMNTGLESPTEIKPFLEAGFEFTHDTAFHSVGSFYSKLYFTVAADVFHIRAFEWISQGKVEKESLLKLSDRFEREIKEGNVRNVFMCRAFNNKKFVEQFCHNLSKKGAESLIKIFSFTDVSISAPMPLPFSFWVGTSRIGSLTERIYSLLCKLPKGYTDNQFDVYFHKCILLIGEYSGEFEFSKLLEIDSGHLVNFTKEYFEKNMHDICHMVLRSDRADEGVCVYLNDLSLNCKRKSDKELINSFLISAVRCDCERFKTVQRLLFLGADITAVDIKKKTVLDHCVEKDHTDNTTFNYLQELTRDVKGETLHEYFQSALLFAVRINRYSRLKTMIFILSYKHDTYRPESANSIFEMALCDCAEGKDPVSNLEKTVRISLLVFYGVWNDLSKSAKDSLRKKFNDLEVLLESPIDERKFCKMIENALEKVRRCCSKNISKKTLERVNILPQMNQRLRARILESISYLCDKRIS